MSEWKIRFGTAGISDSFTAMGYKNSLDIPAYTEKMGLDAFEYQCGHGVRLGLDKARQMADDAAARGILFSVHAPYYISASSLDEEKRLNSVNYLLQSAALCRALGGRRVIFHSGSCGRQSREAALEKALDTLKRAQDALDEAGFAEITLCPETMGKIGQLGTLEEVLALCGVDRRITPCIDFGHLNARTLGGIRSKADYAAILDRIGEALGDARARQFHVHFSRIEYSRGGEKRHWTFAETQFGPEPQPLMELLAERGLAPVIICESAGTQAEDAKTMKRFFEACLCTTSQSGLRPPAPLVGEPLACRSGSRGTREVFRIGNSSALLSRSTDANLCSKARHFMPNQTFSGQLKVSRSANGASHPGCGSQRLLRSRLHPAGRGPNSDSLFPPPAAVVVVALARGGLGIPENFISSPEAPLGRGAVCESD